MFKNYNMKIDAEIFFEENETVQFAAKELIFYLENMADKPLHCKFILGTEEKLFQQYGLNKEKLKYDGFYLYPVEEKTIVILGKLPRAVLFGVYEFLEEQGCIFVYGPGLKEIIPKIQSVSLDHTVMKNPEYELRGMVNGGDLNSEWTAEALETVDNCAKNKINSFFVHQCITNGLTAENRKVMDAVKKRGMIFEFGGHFAQNFVPRELFKEKPDLFIEKDGKRTDKGNFCVSNPESLSLLCENIKSFLDKNKGIDILHLWFDDVVGGSWCTCEKCRSMTALQQQNHVLNIVCDFVKQYYPELKIDLLLYHDTLENVDKLDMSRKNLIGMFAPRERCYAHGLNDCPANEEYFSLLKNVRERCGDNVEAFEYYSDIILFSKCKTVIPHTIEKDMHMYLNVGVNKVTDLGFGAYSAWAYDLNGYVYMKQIFEPVSPVEKAIEKFVLATGCDRVKMRNYFEELEKFSTLYLAFCGYKNNRCDIRRLQLSQYTFEHFEKVKKALLHLNQADKILDEMRMDGDTEYLRAQKEVIEISKLEAEGIYHRINMRLKNLNKQADKDESVKEIGIVKKNLYAIINKLKDNKERAGSQLNRVLIEHLCKDQIFSAEKLLVDEAGLTDIVPDRTKV